MLGWLVGEVDGDKDGAVEAETLGASVGAVLGDEDGDSEAVALGAFVGAVLGDNEGDSEAVTVGLSVGSLVVMHLPPRPGSMMHVLSLAQQGSIGVPSLSSLHLSPESIHFAQVQ